MYSIILVSHSAKITDGLKEMIEEMVGKKNNTRIYSVGGVEDGRLGTDAIRIKTAIEDSKDLKSIFIFCDLGSSILSSQTALDLIEDDELIAKVKIMDAPLIEGAFAAGSQASVGGQHHEIINEVQFIKEFKKID